MQERRERLAAAEGNRETGLNIAGEVEKLARDRGFVTCPMTGRKMGSRMDAKTGPPGPPTWVKGVLKGIEEGRMQPRDFWIQTHEG